MRYEAYLGTSKKEIEDFYVGGKQVEELWDGDTLLWKKGYIVRENVANFCGQSKCTSINGTELLAIWHTKTYYDFDGNCLAFFTGDGEHIREIITNTDEGESWQAVSTGKNFYVIKFKYVERKYVLITVFYKFDEDGNTIYEIHNSNPIPTDGLSEASGTKTWTLSYETFYVINDILYIVMRVSDQLNHPKQTYGWYYLAAYKNGLCTSHKFKIFDNIQKFAESPLYSHERCSNQFYLNGINLIVGGAFFEYAGHDCYPLVKIYPDSFSLLDNTDYTCIGRSGENVYVTETRVRERLFLFDGETYKYVFTPGWKLVSALDIEDRIYVAVVSDRSLPTLSCVIEFDKRTSKSRIIYSINRGKKKKYHWAAIRQLTAKNGKLYVHKDYQTYKDGDYTRIGIDEIDIVDKRKKGDTK